MTQSSDTQQNGPTAQDEAEDLIVMIQADAHHLVEALAAGRKVESHGLVDAILANQQALEDLTRVYHTQH